MSEVNLQEVFTPQFGAAMGKAFGEAMAKQMPVASKATVADPPPYNQIHGIGSMFGSVQVGIDPEVISAMMQWVGLGDHLPKVSVRTVEQFLPFITGVDETSSTERQTECGNCISGETEACIQHFPTALVCRETKAIKLSRAIERLNNGDIDLNLLNDQLGSDSPWHPGWSPSTSSDIMQIYAAWALLFELPPLFQSSLAPMVYTGNPTNNVGNSYREFRGLDLLVNTGHRDAFANVTCPALDSDIKDFNYQDMVTTSTQSFYEVLEMAHWYVMNNAIGQRLMPATWALVIRPPMWQLLSNIVPAHKVMAAMMNVGLRGTIATNLDGLAWVQERDRLRESMTIPLNGQMVPVIIDHGITEQNNANNDNLDPGEYSSDVYLLPMTYLGNRQGLKIEYKDYRFITAEIAATDDMIGGFYKASPDGRFNWSLVRDGPCFKIQAETEPRIILRVPQLAARIQNVKYVPHQHIREPGVNATDYPYRFKGGVSTRGPTSYYY